MGSITREILEGVLAGTDNFRKEFLTGWKGSLALHDLDNGTSTNSDETEEINGVDRDSHDINIESDFD